MKRLLFTLLFTLLFIATSASAQSLYQCGKTFSDKPCGIGQKTLDLPAPNVIHLPKPSELPREPEPTGPRVVSFGEARENSTYCKTIAAKKANSERWAATFRHPANIRQAQAEAKALDDLYFSNCYGR